MNKIICIVDNEAKVKSFFKTEHGVAFWIETEYGNILFDTGQSTEVLENNLAELGLDLMKLNAMAISHAHFDHTGGLRAVLRKRPGIDLYANADVFHPRYFLRDGKYENIGLEQERDYYKNLANVHLSSEATEILPNLWTTGEIRIRDEPEGRDAHYILENGKFILDPFKDDMSLILKTPEGMILICGCCHAGLLNTLALVEQLFKERVHAIIGGTHLMTADEDLLNHVIKVLKKNYPELRMYLNHCTGDTAINALQTVYGDRVQHFTAGSSVQFGN